MRDEPGDGDVDGVEFNAVFGANDVDNLLNKPRHLVRKRKVACGEAGRHKVQGQRDGLRIGQGDHCFLPVVERGDELAGSFQFLRVEVTYFGLEGIGDVFAPDGAP
ncbi:Uncharacterised protein [Corynebacterium renale]|nr:Uncharacterised protein [Corynebacterium renale]